VGGGRHSRRAWESPLQSLERHSGGADLRVRRRAGRRGARGRAALKAPVTGSARCQLRLFGLKQSLPDAARHDAVTEAQRDDRRRHCRQLRRKRICSTRTGLDLPAGSHRKTRDDVAAAGGGRNLSTVIRVRLRIVALMSLCGVLLTSGCGSAHKGSEVTPPSPHIQQLSKLEVADRYLHAWYVSHDCSKMVALSDPLFGVECPETLAKSLRDHEHLVRGTRVIVHDGACPTLIGADAKDCVQYTLVGYGKDFEQRNGQPFDTCESVRAVLFLGRAAGRWRITASGSTEFATTECSRPNFLALWRRRIAYAKGEALSRLPAS